MSENRRKKRADELRHRRSRRSRPFHAPNDDDDDACGAAFVRTRRDETMTTFDFFTERADEAFVHVTVRARREDGQPNGSRGRRRGGRRRRRRFSTPTMAAARKKRPRAARAIAPAPTRRRVRRSVRGVAIGTPAHVAAVSSSSSWCTTTYARVDGRWRRWNFLSVIVFRGLTSEVVWISSRSRSPPECPSTFRKFKLSASACQRRAAGWIGLARLAEARRRRRRLRQAAHGGRGCCARRRGAARSYRARPVHADASVRRSSPSPLGWRSAFALVSA